MSEEIPIDLNGRRNRYEYWWYEEMQFKGHPTARVKAAWDYKEAECQELREKIQERDEYIAKLTKEPEKPKLDWSDHNAATEVKV